MKYGIVVSVSKTKFGPVVFKENLNENIIKASNMGYGGVELAIRKPEAVNTKEVARLTDKYGLEVLSIGTGQIYGEEGLNFSDPDKDIRKKAVERTKKIINIAKVFNASIIIGLVRGNIDGPEDFESKLEIAEENISQCLGELMSYSGAEGIKFLIEPINRYEINIFNRLDEVYNFILKYKDKLDLERIGILADTFHMNIEEPVIEESLRKYADLIKHIHFADSNRWPPGYGHIDFKKIMDTLQEVDYSGYISFEMLPMPDPDTAAKHAIEYIKGIEE